MTIARLMGTTSTPELKGLGNEYEYMRGSTNAGVHGRCSGLAGKQATLGAKQQEAAQSSSHCREGAGLAHVASVWS